jgi:glycosyltransferase involved in cell wall biosynthesis
MNISVVICSVNRPNILHDTLLSILSQTHKPGEVLIVSPAKEHVLAKTREMPGVRFVLSPLGLTAQRNAGLECINHDCDLVAFFDDDIELSATYLENVERLFSENGDVLIASGRLLHDGGRGTAITRDQACELCREYDRSPKPVAAARCILSDSAYGCNMVVRYAATKGVRFDEGLPLYAWLEDRDYSHRITKSRHHPVEFQGSVAVHLGSRSGRIGGVRMGFSEIVNPLYLWARNRTFPLRYIVVQYWIRCLVGNILGTLARDSEYDRVGLLSGNLLGFTHLCHGLCDPAHITKLAASNPSPISLAIVGERSNDITKVAS